LALKLPLPQLIAQSSVAPLVLNNEHDRGGGRELRRKFTCTLASRGCALRLLEGDPLLDESLQLTLQPAVVGLVPAYTEPGRSGYELA
jgi:hypothetical protein